MQDTILSGRVAEDNNLLTTVALKSYTSQIEDESKSGDEVNGIQEGGGGDFEQRSDSKDERSLGTETKI